MTDSMEQSPFWEVISSSPSQQTIAFYGTRRWITFFAKFATCSCSEPH